MYTQVHAHMCTHARYLSLQSLLSLTNYLSQKPPSNSNQKLYWAPMFRQIPVQVTHPNPPAGIWATAAFLKTLWAPAACQGKGLRRAAMSNWRPQSSARGPGLSGRRQKSGKDRAPGGESKFLSI